MLELTRTIRFSLLGDGSLKSEGAVHNSFAGWPAMEGLGRYYELTVTCRGEADGVTGFFINIVDIDRAVRDGGGLEVISEYARGENAGVGFGQLLGRVIEVLQVPLGGAVWAVALQLTPASSIRMEADRMGDVYLSQDFDFAAAHRLHVASMSEAENQKVFGKCNNAAGHGHNYRLRVVAKGSVDGEGRVGSLAELDEFVERVIIRELDHKHLNEDVVWFEKLNPTVENITRVIYEKLAAAMDEDAFACGLDEVTVWETSKTRCSYRG